jgi:hypothetical protein
VSSMRMGGSSSGMGILLSARDVAFVL